MTKRNPRLAHFLLGVEGMAMLRSWPDRIEDIDARTADIAELLQQLRDPDSSVEFSAKELDVSKGYDLISQSYDESAFRNPAILAEEQPFGALVDGLGVGKVLDAACGTGRWTRRLVDLGHQVTGMDMTSSMLEQAREKVPEAEFHMGSLERMPFPDNSFDAAICTLALTHLQSLTPAFREFVRVLRPGGALLTSDIHPLFSSLGFHAFQMDSAGDMAFVRNHYHPLLSYFKAAGVCDLRIELVDEGFWTEELIATQRWASQIPEAATAALSGLPLILLIKANKPG